MTSAAEEAEKAARHKAAQAYYALRRATVKRQEYLQSCIEGNVSTYEIIIPLGIGIMEGDFDLHGALIDFCHERMKKPYFSNNHISQQ